MDDHEGGVMNEKTKNYDVQIIAILDFKFGIERKISNPKPQIQN
ncbi:hypothetical protein [Nostoc sp.]